MKYDNKAFEDRYNAWKEGADYWKDLRGVDLSTKLESTPTVSLDDLIKHANDIKAYQDYASLEQYDDGKDFFNQTADYVAGFEGFIPKAKDIGDGKITIGYGTTNPRYAKVGATMTKGQARRIMLDDLKERDARLTREMPNYRDLPDSAKRAMLSYDYNYPATAKSSPKLYKALAQRNWNAAAAQMDAGWNQEGFKEGLRDRRLKERALFLSELNGFDLKPAPKRKPAMPNLKQDLQRRQKALSDISEPRVKANPAPTYINTPANRVLQRDTDQMVFNSAMGDMRNAILSPIQLPNVIQNVLQGHNRGKDGYGLKFWQRAGNNLHFDEGKDPYLYPHN